MSWDYFFLENGQNMHTHMKKHESKWQSKSLEIRKYSAFYVHMKNDYDDVDITGKNIVFCSHHIQSIPESVNKAC